VQIRLFGVLGTRRVAAWAAGYFHPVICTAHGWVLPGCADATVAGLGRAAHRDGH
jgi:hypothetical protein